MVALQQPADTAAEPAGIDPPLILYPRIAAVQPCSLLDVTPRDTTPADSPEDRDIDLPFPQEIALRRVNLLE
jgi:hypothetical protein